MKKLFFGLTILALVYFPVRDGYAQVKEATVRVEFKDGFKHDAVKILVKDDFKYQNPDVTTNPVDHSACETEFKISWGNWYMVKFFINDKMACEKNVQYPKYPLPVKI